MKSKEHVKMYGIRTDLKKHDNSSLAPNARTVQTCASIEKNIPFLKQYFFDAPPHKWSQFCILTSVITALWPDGVFETRAVERELKFQAPALAPGI